MTLMIEAHHRVASTWLLLRALYTTVFFLFFISAEDTNHFTMFYAQQWVHRHAESRRTYRMLWFAIVSLLQCNVTLL